MYRRNVLSKMAAIGTLGFTTAGCIFSESDESGVLLDSIRFVNIDEKARQFTVKLLSSDEEVVFTDTFRVQGAPGNKYSGREVDDLPSAPASIIEASVSGNHTTNKIPKNRDPAIPSIMYHPERGTGIAWWESGEEESQTENISRADSF
jgi:hypothetical protein